MRMLSAHSAMALALAGTMLLPFGHASATLLGPATGSAMLQLRNVADGSALVDVQFRRRSGAAAGAFIAGAIVGGIIASQVGPGYPYYYAYYPPYAYRAPVYDGAVAYCMRRFRSYDPYTMTYLGYDGRRHPCP